MAAVVTLDGVHDLRVGPPPAALRAAARSRFERLGHTVEERGDDLLVHRHGLGALVRFSLERQATEADVRGLVVDASRCRAVRRLLYAPDFSDPARRLAAAEGVELMGPPAIRELAQASPAA